MEEGADVVVVCEILDEPRVLLTELGDLLPETDSSCVDNREVVSKRLQEFHRARLEHLIFVCPTCL
jgi:hypothetical protein